MTSEPIRMLKLTRHFYEVPGDDEPPRDEVVYIAANAIRRISIDDTFRDGKITTFTCIETSDQGTREEVFESPDLILLMMSADVVRTATEEERVEWRDEKEALAFWVNSTPYRVDVPKPTAIHAALERPPLPPGQPVSRP